MMGKCRRLWQAKGSPWPSSTTAKRSHSWPHGHEGPSQEDRPNAQGPVAEGFSVTRLRKIPKRIGIRKMAGKVCSGETVRQRCRWDDGGGGGGHLGEFAPKTALKPFVFSRGLGDSAQILSNLSLIHISEHTRRTPISYA